MDSIGIIRLSSLGDIILTEPVTRILKKNFPDAVITFFTREMYRPVVEMLPAVDQILGFEIPGREEKLGELKARVKSLPYDFDLLLDLHRNIRSRTIVKNLRAFRKLTYNKSRLSRQFAVWFKSRKKPLHTVEKYLALLDDLMVISMNNIPRLSVPREKMEAAEKYISEIGFEPGEFVVLGVGASHPPKHYPIQQFSRLAEMIRDKYKLKILVVEEEQFGYLNLFDNLKSAGSLEYAMGMDMKKLAGVMGRARMTISNDSGIMHLSAALDVPTAGLFGPTHPVLGFAPLGKNSLAITTDEKCSPCSVHGERLCYRDKQYCFLNMTPELIVSKVEKYLQ